MFVYTVKQMGNSLLKKSFNIIMKQRLYSFFGSNTPLYIIFGLLAVPFLIEFLNLPWGHEGYEHFLKETGEFAARFLVITLLISPLRILFPKNGLLTWMHKRKRAFGIYTFVFSALHLAGYLTEHYAIGHIIGEMGEEPSVLFGWAAFIIFLPLALTSNNFSVRMMRGKKWKYLQRFVYLAALLVAVHWFWGDHGLNWTPVLIHFIPLLLLELYRIYHNMRQSSQGQFAFN